VLRNKEVISWLVFYFISRFKSTHERLDDESTIICLYSNLVILTPPDRKFYEGLYKGYHIILKGFYDDPPYLVINLFLIFRQLFLTSIYYFFLPLMGADNIIF
jgi:hypothetical protein